MDKVYRQEVVYVYVPLCEMADGNLQAFERGASFGQTPHEARVCADRHNATSGLDHITLAWSSEFCGPILLGCLSPEGCDSSKPFSLVWGAWLRMDKGLITRLCQSYATIALIV